MKRIEVGLTKTASLLVTPQLLVPAFAKQLFPTWRDMPDVLATIIMVGLIEEACVNLLHPLLAADEITVGSRVHVDHLAPTPLGLRITAEVVLTEVSGAKFVFAATCRDSLEIIGRGSHVRRMGATTNYFKRIATGRVKD